jgi:putative glutamine amidotransferase
MSASPRIQISGIAGKTHNYEEAVRNAGGLPFSGYAPEPDLSCHGLVLCGGGDVLPSLYGQENTASSLLDLRRDEAEQNLIHAYAQAGKPILGICRGMQILNVAFGGTLIQDLPQEQRPFHDDVTATYAYLAAEALGLEPYIMGYGAVGVTRRLRKRTRMSHSVSVFF